MDFWFAAFVVVSTIGIVLCIALVLAWRSMREEVLAARAELAAFQKTPDPPVASEEPDIPERLGDLLRMVEEDIHVPLAAIPPSLRKSGQPIVVQKLAVLMQDPEAKPEEFDHLWVEVVANLSKTNPDATLGEIADEFNRLAALEETSSQTAALPLEGETAPACGRARERLAATVRPSFQALYEEHFPGVFAAVQRFGVPAQDAEDVAVAVFLAVFKAFDPWLKAITYRTAREHLERGGVR
jgi:hypothetical protein